MAHWTKDRHCVTPACGCIEYRPKKATNKYGAAKTEIKGAAFDSMFEGRVGVGLAYRKKAGEIFEIRRQVDFPLFVGGIKISTYRADFLLEFPDGSKEVVEAKGFLTREAALKMKLFEALYPEIKFTMETQRKRWGRKAA